MTKIHKNLLLLVFITWCTNVQATDVLFGFSSNLTSRAFSVPQAPVITSLTAGYQQITVAFTAPEDNGGFLITNYEYNLNNSDIWVPFSPVSTSGTFTITGLTNDQTYIIQLRAVNEAANGLASEKMTATPRDITVTITELDRHIEIEEPMFYDEPSTKTIRNTVTFPSGPGVFNGPGFNASFGQGDVIVTRFVPPAGSYFAVKKHPDSSIQMFNLNGVWQGGSGSTSNFPTPTITFENLTGTAPTITYSMTALSNIGNSLVVDFQSNVIADFTFTAIKISFPVTHSVTRTNRKYGSVTSGSSPSFGVSARGTENLEEMALFTIVGEADQLVFTSSTETLVSGNSRQLTVEIHDAEGDLVVNDNSRLITFSKTSGDGTVMSLGTATTTFGIARLTVTGESSGGLTIESTASGLTSATTTFTISPGVATKLALVNQPENAVHGESTGTITVEILDANGNRVTNNNSSVTLSIANNPGSGTLSGTATINAISGLATFSGLSINKTGDGYTLSAASQGLPSVTSSAFNVTTKALTIADPTLTRTKKYDGTTDAVGSAGGLIGVAVGETVTVGAVASYDTESVGTGKTITVVYTLGGTDAAKYSAPSNFVANDGVITAAALAFGIFPAINKQYFAGPYTIVPPTTNNSNPIVYTSDNTSIASISGSVITFIGIGTANIIATQAADANYEGGTVSTLLSVFGKDLLSKYGGISSTDVNYVNANGKIGNGFGVDKYGAGQDVLENYALENFITSGLIMHLDAGNPASYLGTGNIWTDLSGSENHGTLVNGVGYTSMNRGAFVFDGVNDYFVTNNNFNLSITDKLTVQILLKTETSGQKMLMEHSVNWNLNNAFGIFQNDSKMQFTDKNQGYNVHNSTKSINDNSWHLVSATTDRSLDATNQSLIYIDDDAPNSEIVPTLANDNNGNYVSHKLYIGSRAGSSFYFNGSIAHVLIYNRALTAAEIQQNFTALKVRYGL
jgi:hypothetical protein